MASSFDRGVKRVLANLEKKIGNKAKEELENLADNILNTLSTPWEGNGNHKWNTGQGMAVQADKRSAYSKNNWRGRLLKSGKSSIRYRFVNTKTVRGYPYVKSIYGEDKAYRHKDGRIGASFRSKKLTSRRWKSFTDKVAGMLAGKIKTGFEL